MAVLTAALALGSAHLTGARQQPPPQAETHWDKYKNQRAEPFGDRRLADPVLNGAIDLHAHPDPDVYPRQADAFDMARLARERGLRGIVLKNHFTETAGLAELVRKHATPGFDVFGAVTLDLPVGGLNPQAIRYMADVAGSRGRIVWFPTHDSEHEVRYNKESRPFVPVSRNGTLLPEVHEVIAVIAQHDLTLATGHVDPDEALAILRAAKAAGVTRLVVTHPMFAPQYTWMTIDQMRIAADLGAFLEITGNSIVRDPEAKPRVLAAIRAIGARHFVVSSDSGLIGTPNVPDTLALVAKAFREAGVSEADLGAMFRDNPAFLVNLPPPAAAAPQSAARSGQAAVQQQIDRLEAGVQAQEGIRAVKRLQQTYGHYLEAGLWDDAADLFTDAAVAQLPSGTGTGKDGIRRRLMQEAARSSPGLAAGQLNTHLILQPIVTIGPDGTTAKGTWHELAMLGQFGVAAVWKGGVYENEYVRERGVWKISRVRYVPQYSGAYEDYGHKAPPRWDISYHFTGAHVGVTIPDSAMQPNPATRSTGSPAARLADLTQRVRRMSDETDVQNLQHSFGYYFDRKMYDDVADLFVADGTLDLASQGAYAGRDRIRRALDVLYGPPPLKYGELFDHINLATVVTVAPDGQTAAARTTQLGMLGRNGEYARWELGTYENEFVKRDGVWQFKAVHYFPRMATDYDKGWAQDARPAPDADPAFKPDRVLVPSYASYPQAHGVAFHFANPVTGRPVRYPPGPMAAVTMLAAAPRTSRATAAAAANLETMVADAARRLDAVIGVDAVENLNSSYGYFIDESDWDQMADTFATTAGAKEITGAGTYVGRERIRTILNLRGPRGGRSPTFFTIHQLTQPVIHVAADGQSAKARLRLFQGGGNADGSSGSWIGGLYENTAVKENGEWKFGIQDLHHTFNASYRNGWARFGAARGTAANSAPVAGAPAAGERAGNAPAAGARAGGAPAGRDVPGGGIQQGLGGAASPNRLVSEFPPDRPIRSRQYAFPEIDEPAFHYTNPVSGRVPARLLP